ncbi:MAG: carboxylating nicotinate-nucleotide diphosphorylase [Planctomycetota bacterium]|jgi:nicotinate-nucleotide pyrophosphorylase (carboxylating)
MNVLNEDNVARLIALAKDEDLGSGDLTAGLLPEPGEHASFRLVAKAGGVFAGREIAPLVLRAYDESIEIEWADSAADGALIDVPPATLATISGPLGALLSAERVLLNFLQRLCGVATLTRQFVDAVAGTETTILDTRKTTPGWRSLEKYAVRCGGGTNHRQGLYDAVLIKDNHLAGVEDQRLAGTVFEQLNRLLEGGPKPAFIEVEADTLQQVEELYKVVGIDLILLDNFSPDALRRAVALRNELGLDGKVALEASGGVTLAGVRALAETGVDRISVGAITHSATALDLSLERI